MTRGDRLECGSELVPDLTHRSRGIAGTELAHYRVAGSGYVVHVYKSRDQDDYGTPVVRGEHSGSQAIRIHGVDTIYVLNV